MPDDTPLISVIIPAYQAAQTLGRALDSALAQDYPALEVIVADDGSTDATRRDAEAYQARDPRVRYLWQPNQGPGAARNLAVAHSHGEYLAFLDADDEWRPGKLRLQSEVLAQDTSIGLIFTDGLDVDAAKGRTVVHSAVQTRAMGTVSWRPLERVEDVAVAQANLRPILFLNCFISVSTVVMRRSVFRQVGGFRVPRLGPEDIDLWMRALCVCDLAYCSQKLVIHHMLTTSISHRGETWINELIAYYQMCLSSPNYADLRAEARRGLRRWHRHLVFYYGRRWRPRQALAAFRASQAFGFDWLSLLCAAGAWLGPLPFRAAGRLIWP